MIPDLFLILVDQNILKADSVKKKYISEFLILLLQSLPSGSYYQIIGFGYGSNNKINDEQPKEYNQKNIEESIKSLEKLEGYMNANDLYEALNYIYNSNKIYQKILLPKKIFLFSNSVINNKDKNLELIEKNKNEFSNHSFGYGEAFDSDFLKKATEISKGIYAFSPNYSSLRNLVSKMLNQICVSKQRDLRIISSLDKFNLIKNKFAEEFNPNEIYRLNYIIEEKIIDKEKLKFTFDFEYNKEKYPYKYTIEPIELTPGEELSKLIIYDYIHNKNDLTDEEKIKLALKYQLFIEGTSLFAEVELKDKIKEKIIIKKIKDNSAYNIDQKIDKIVNDIMNLENKMKQNKKVEKEKLKSGDKKVAEKLTQKNNEFMDKMKQYEASLELMEKQKLIDNRINKEINAIKYQKNNLPDNYSKEELEDIMKSEKELEEFFKEINGDNSKENEQKLFNATTVEESFLNVGIGDLNVNDNLKKLIRWKVFGILIMKLK